MPELNPYVQAKRDAGRHIKRAWYRAVDFAKTYVTVALVKQLGVGLVALVAAALNFPVFAFAIVAVALVSFAVYSIYATKLLKAQDRDERWTYVARKRAHQDVLDAKIALDTATLALMGERHQPRAMRGASPELRSAVAYLQHRLRLAEERAAAAEAVVDGNATDAQRRALTRSKGTGRQPTPPKGPAVDPIKAHREALVAERAELEAEIKSLATADDIDHAMKAEELAGARRTRRQRQEAARKADQAARDRVRAGKEPTRREPELAMSVQVAANGNRTVGTDRGPTTPEQIANDDNAA